MKPFATLLLTLLGAGIAQAQSCDCAANLTRLRELIERNYAGYTDKVTPATSARHQQRFDSALTAARAVTAPSDASPGDASPGECTALLERYVQFFGDGHLQLAGPTPADAQAAAPERYPLTRVQAESYFRANRTRLHPVEGLWQSDDYQLAVVRDQQSATPRYVGVVLSAKNPNWQPGLVKMALRPVGKTYFDVTYTFGDFSREETEATQTRNILDIFRAGPFEKTAPAGTQPVSLATYQSPYPTSEVSIRWLDDRTVLLQLLHFRVQNQRLLDSLMAHHAERLRRTPDWIIDVRNNGGGGTGTYRAILPYLYTGPIIGDGSRYWLSEENVAKYEKALRETTSWPVEVRQFYEQAVARGKAQPNSWLDEPGDTIRYATVQPNPKRVAVLANQQSGSSAEIFVMTARQSQKVTTFGTNTGGVVDYGDGNEFSLACPDFRVSIPVRRSNYLDTVRYDGVGIAPDVRIPATERDWINVVRTYWKRPVQAQRRP